MKAAVLYGYRDIRIEDLPYPEIMDDEVLIKVACAGICGTDLKAYKDKSKTVSGKRVMGHEVTGVVQKIGNDVNNIKIGDNVVVDPNITCGKCYFCRMDERNYYCLNKKVLGRAGWLNGGFSEFLRVPERVVYRLPEAVSLEKGCLTEPVACCIRAIDRLNLKTGDTVAIIGAGVLGLLSLQLAKLSGASTIIITDISDIRLEKAREFGAEVAINPTLKNIQQEVIDITRGIGVDKAIEAVGSVDTIKQGLDIIRRGGSLGIIGATPPQSILPIKPYELHKKEITITTSYCNPFTFQRAIKLLEVSKINADKLITHRYPLDQIREALNTTENDDNRIKVIISKKPY